METNLINPFVFAVPCFIAFLAIEIHHWLTDGPKDLYKLKDLKASSFIAFGTMLLGPIAKTTFITTLLIITYEFFNPEVNGVRTNILGYESFGFAWYVWIFCQLADDFTFYWYHRFSHTIRLFWAAHIVHHSS